jgi:hypothetical protein
MFSANLSDFGDSHGEEDPRVVGEGAYVPFGSHTALVLKFLSGPRKKISNVWPLIHKGVHTAQQLVDTATFHFADGSETTVACGRNTWRHGDTMQLNMCKFAGVLSSLCAARLKRPRLIRVKRSLQKVRKSVSQRSLHKV